MGAAGVRIRLGRGKRTIGGAGKINRAIRANVIAWMRGQDDVLGSDAGRLADGLDQLQPGQIKGWLHEHGVDPDKFKDGIPDKRINPQFGK